MMSQKRSLESDSRDLIKKVKVEEPCYFPLGVLDIVRKIGKYFQGDYITNYKLVCKRINSAMKDIKPEPMEINGYNYEKACMIPGHHFIRINEYTHFLLESLQIWVWKRVTRLVLDYGGRSEDRYVCAEEFLKAFRFLSSLKIIRCTNFWGLSIYQDYDTLSTLEIYTKNDIFLVLRRKVENVRLYSSFKIDLDTAIISIRVPRELVEYAKNIPYCALSRKVAVVNNDEIVDRSGSHKDFVPNPKFL